MADDLRGKRPLSPFMIGPYYRPQITSMTSIANRIAGTGLGVAAILVVWWFLAAATSADSFATADGVITSFLGDLVMVVSAWALWYHALAGLRHLYWDSGRGLEIETAERLGIVVIVASVAMTILTVLAV
ncbi:succinate dehydrogenase, cytochrome b556 subunit [Silicimonas algicola]|uniref:Succinate dehydrogenase cytochrome b556 subunit n=1 Tax=Silicimonas algicola TaxID=1826607 RepID=A0A316GM71_9RHOB|nr:succinate dehydrogenase, cytochrome b556 subunit [Silicimonas algicola]AZQ68951.1 succinate dehydrogenase, cytochrome b556 subunit [Silicimonas algicola]PWK55947.1 succinate dehydrogenase subunit C [Silicimonas algicola]